MKILEEYGINFKDESLLNVALTHSSYANEHDVESYERLEYLGDAVLELVCSDYLFNNKNKYPEGEMSRLRRLYVCEKALYEYAKKIKLSDYIKVSSGTKMPNQTVIADVFEAIIGVIYIENGLSKVKEFFDKLIAPYIEEKKDFLMDYKSVLQELVQTDRQCVTYSVLNESGPQHNKRFEVAVYVEGIEYGRGIGKSKKEAEQSAAMDAINKQA